MFNDTVNNFLMTTNETMSDTSYFLSYKELSFIRLKDILLTTR